MRAPSRRSPVVEASCPPGDDLAGGRGRGVATLRAVADTTSELSLPSDLTLTPLDLRSGALGTGRALNEWLTTFHLASVVLDPYTNESSWILRTATRILEELRGSHARINFIVTATADDTMQFLGPLAEQFLVFCDPDRTAVAAMQLNELPAFTFIRVDGVLAAKAEGWKPEAWEQVGDAIATVTKWSGLSLPAPGDPGPFAGSPAAG